jgi:hypothetical protein
MNEKNIRVSYMGYKYKYKILAADNIIKYHQHVILAGQIAHLIEKKIVSIILPKIYPQMAYV